MQTKTFPWFIACLAGSAAILLPQSFTPTVRAETLNLVQQAPDIMTINLDLGYSASTGVFSALGKADQLDLTGGSPQAILNDNNFSGPFATFQLDFKVDQNGKLTTGVTGSDLTIKGVLDTDNSGTKNGSESFQTLLEAEVNGFGFNEAGGEIFEVTAAVTGGTLADEFSPGGIGLILNAQNSGFNGLFNVDFANSMSAGVSDTFGRTPIPEPSSWLVFVVVGLVWAGLSAKRWRGRRQLAHAKLDADPASSQSQITG